MLIETLTSADTSVMTEPNPIETDPIETDPVQQHQTAVADMLSNLDGAYHAAVRERDAKAAEDAYTAIDRVRRVHRQNRHNRCDGCATSYPCATIVALDAIPSQQAYEARRGNHIYEPRTFRPLSPVEAHCMAVAKILADPDAAYDKAVRDSAAVLTPADIKALDDL